MTDRSPHRQSHPRTRQLKWMLVLLFLYSAVACPESGNYRIEVLLFNHLDPGSEAAQLDEIRSFHAYPSLDKPMVSEAPMKLDVMSSTMQDAWRRLRLSADFRPLLFVAWEQSRIDYHPPVRVHDDELIAEHLDFPYQLAFIDLQSPDMFDHYLAPYYRLDGTVQLVRSRFLHLNLDLEYRQDLLPRPAPLSASREEAIELSIQQEQALDPTPGPGPALVHALVQSRQVRTAQMQYFDTPYLGALVRITATSGK